MSEAQDAKDKELETLRRENAMLKNECDQLKEQVKEGTETFKDLTAKEAVRKDAERQDIIETLLRDTEGKIARDALEALSYDQLCVAKTVYDKTRPKSFASIIAAKDAEARKPKPVSLTVGQWDPVKKEWTGGM